MIELKLHCEGCGLTYDLKKTKEIPEHIHSMKCNWCPMCEESAHDDYEEWWDEEENVHEVIINNPNQLNIF